ncbi:MAG: DUF3108 domain-containing protein [Parvibaculum sp.]
MPLVAKNAPKRQTTPILGACALILSLTAGASGQAQAETRTNIGVDYQIALGGFDFGQADVIATLDGETYEMEARITTAGIAEKFFETRFALESAGSLADGRVRPSRFLSTYEDDDSSRRVELNYGASGTPVMTAEPAYEDGFGPNVGANDILMTQDPISALLLPTKGNGTSPCERSLPLFDGRRRYDLKLREEGMSEISSAEAAYSGPVMRCSVSMIPVAGYERKTLIKLLEREDTIQIWLAPVNDGEIWVPVRMTLRTPFGGAIMRASRFDVSSVATN